MRLTTENNEINHEKNFGTHEIPTRKNVVPTRKNLGPTTQPREKIWYPREKNWDPLNTHEENVCVTIGNLAFCFALYLTGVHFRGELQHVGHVGEQKIKCRPIRTRDISGVGL